MEFPNYPWKKFFSVSEESFKEWKKNPSGKSFLALAIEKKLIPREKYFQWARDHYQVAFLESGFFEHKIMGKDQWRRVKDLRKWSAEVLPVWEWSETVYVGCMEPPKDHESWPFSHRLVLVTDLVLRSCWRTVNDFTDLLPQPQKKSNPVIQSSLPVESPSEQEYDPVEEPQRRGHDPDRESERADNIIPLHLTKKKETSKEESQSFEKTSFSHSLNTAEKQQDELFKTLWKKTKNCFSGVALLEHKDSQFYILKSMGSIQPKEDKKALISLNETSFLSVLSKGYDYHGFVMENENNKKFFKNINWTNLPKHVTAFSVSGGKENLKTVFLGVAIKKLSNPVLNEMKKIVSSIYEENRTAKVAA